jgi:carboxylesterase
MGRSDGMTGDARAATGELPAVLLIHGFNGEPLDMEELEARLRARGHATRNLLLPGHGTHVREFARMTFADWSGAVEGAARELLREHRRLLVMGHSMGGALTLHLAAREPRVAGIVALCPPLRMFPGQFEFAARLRHVLPYLPTIREDVYDPGARYRYDRHAYHWTPVAAAHSLFSHLPRLRGELAHIHCPALVVVAQKDHVVPAGDGIEIFRRLGTNDRELMVLERSYHVVMKDVEREDVFQRVEAFAHRVATQPAPTTRARPRPAPPLLPQLSALL